MSSTQEWQAQLPLPFVEGRLADFELFLPGDNVEVLSVLQAQAAGSGSPDATYVWGLSGTGKSHLLQAACRRASDAGRSSGLVACSEMRDLTPGLLDGMDELDLVCIDDLQAIAGEPAWELAIFNLFNLCRDKQRHILISGSAAAVDLGLRLKDLESRLGWGLAFQLKPLTDMQKVAALQLRATVRGFELRPEVGRYMLQRLPRDTVGLFAALDRLDEATLARRRRLTIPLVRELLGDRQPGV